MGSPSVVDDARIAQQRWSRITATARTAEQHAAVMDVRRRFNDDPPPVAAMVDAYRAVIAAHTYAPLNDVALPMVQLADLTVIIDAATAGLPAAAVEQMSRDALRRHRLVALVDPDGRMAAFPDDPRTRIVGTRAGLAVLRGAKGRPLRLSESDAFTLAQIDAHHPKVWPGTVSCLRGCEFWGLTRRDGDRYAVTAVGRTVLALHRGNDGSERNRPNDGQAGVLQQANDDDGGGVDLSACALHHVAQCVTRQWLVKARTVRPTGRGSPRPLYRITDSGRDALTRYELARGRSAGIPGPVTVEKIQQGQRIRLANRRGLGLPGTYVLLVSKRKALVPGTSNNHGWELWVTDPDRGGPYLYGGKAFYPTARCEIEPDTAAA